MKHAKLSEDLHRALRHRAADEGTTLTSLVDRLLRDALFPHTVKPANPAGFSMRVFATVEDQEEYVRERTAALAAEGQPLIVDLEGDEEAAS
jgi:hypothetical protein